MLRRFRCPESLGFGLVAFVLLTIGNGRIDYLDRDEPRYAGTALNMLKSGDFVVPYFNGDFRFQKPILTYWLHAFAFTVFAAEPWAARLVSVASLLAAAFLVRRLGDQWFGPPTGRIAGWMLILSPIGFLLGRLAIPDGPQLLFATLALACLYAMRPGADPTLARRAAFWFFVTLGLALLTKGPIVPGMALAAALVYAVLTRQPITQFAWHPFLGLLVFACVALPWFVAILWTAGPAFLEESVGHQLADRVVTSFDGRIAPPGYYLGSLLLGLAPWGLMLLWSLRIFRKRLRCPGPHAYAFAWLLGPTVLVELFSSKQPHYIAPAFPAAVLLAALPVAMASRGEFRWSRWNQIGLAVGLGVTCLAVLVGWIVVLFIAPAGMRPWAWWAGSATLISGIVSLWCVRQHSLTGVFRTQWATLLVLGLLVGGGLVPAYSAVRVTAPVADRLALERQRTGDRILLHRVAEPSMVVIARQTLPTQEDSELFHRALHHANQPVLSALTDSDLAQLPQPIADRVEILEQFDGWVKMHPDRVYLVRIHPPSTEVANKQPVVR